MCIRDRPEPGGRATDRALTRAASGVPRGTAAGRDLATPAEGDRTRRLPGRTAPGRAAARARRAACERVREPRRVLVVRARAAPRVVPPPHCRGARPGYCRA